MDTLTNEQRKMVVSLMARGCARFMKNISRYKRSYKNDNQYKWVWDGLRITVRITAEEYEKLEPDMMKHSVHDKYLVIAGEQIGRIVCLGKARYFPGYFLSIDLDEKFQYDTTVIPRLARYAGYQDPQFDTSLLEIDREPVDGPLFFY